MANTPWLPALQPSLPWPYSNSFHWGHCVRANLWMSLCCVVIHVLGLERRTINTRSAPSPSPQFHLKAGVNLQPGPSPIPLACPLHGAPLRWFSGPNLRSWYRAKKPPERRLARGCDVRLPLPLQRTDLARLPLPRNRLLQPGLPQPTDQRSKLSFRSVQLRPTNLNQLT